MGFFFAAPDLRGADAKLAPDTPPSWTPEAGPPRSRGASQGLGPETRPMGQNHLTRLAAGGRAGRGQG
eukprot:3979012-Pyramimonas_sp.AAC.1